MSKLLMTVQEMQDRDKWLRYRNLGLGGSDAGTVCGLNKWKSSFQLWMEKTEQSEPDDLSGNEYTYWGTVLEEAVANRFCELTGKKVRRQGLMQSEEHPFMLASVDRMIVGENAGLECKTANGFAAKEWEGDDVPDSYYCQCMHYMAVTGADRWYIACLIGGNHFVWKTIERNENEIKALIQAEEDFWSKVMTKTMPGLDGSDSCAEALRERFKGGKVEPIELENKDDLKIKRYFDLKETRDALDEQMKVIKNELCQTLGDNEVGITDNYKVSWRNQQGRKGLDAARLEKELPDIYNKYLKVGKPTRVFKII